MAQARQMQALIVEVASTFPDWNEDFLHEIPVKWELHGNIVVISEKSFRNKFWTRRPRFLEEFARALKVTTIARKTGPTHDPNYRRPSVELIFGNDTIAAKRENGIIYKWDVTKCMFSSGNLSEKQRIAQWDLMDKVIVDLYAGIGYFALSYLVHSRAKHVYACEWNPDAIDWLKLNLKLNNVEERATVIEGDNKVYCPTGVADHVNLGLIPSSEASWAVACAALKPSGGILHIHGNVDVDRGGNGRERTDWAEKVKESIKKHFITIYPKQCWSIKVQQVLKIKSFGPRVDHLVADVVCSPQSSD